MANGVTYNINIRNLNGNYDSYDIGAKDTNITLTDVSTNNFLINSPENLKTILPLKFNQEIINTNKDFNSINKTGYYYINFNITTNNPSFNDNTTVGSSLLVLNNIQIAFKGNEVYTRSGFNGSWIKGLGTDYVVATGSNDGIRGLIPTPTKTTSNEIYLNATGGWKDITNIYPRLAVENTFTNKNNFTNATDISDVTFAFEKTECAVKVTGGLYAKGKIKSDGGIYGAVWNDLADSIPVNEEAELEAGYCYCIKNGKYSKSSKYMDNGIIGIHSDTYGFKMGGKPDCKQLDCAVSGFVLAYVDKEYLPGTALTCTKDGHLTKMKFKDKQKYPERIVATYWKDEPNEEWGSDTRKVKVNGRKWVKIK